MKYESAIYIKSQNFIDIIYFIINNENEYVPAKFSSSEFGKKKSIKSSKCIKVGYFLWGDDFVYELLRDRDGYILYFSSNQEKSIPYIINFFSILNPFYSYGCLLEERLHKNRIHIKTNFGSIEYWVGRYYHRYIPGIYWINLFSKDFLHIHKIDISSLKDNSFKYIDYNFGIIFQVYEFSNSWREEFLSNKFSCLNLFDKNYVEGEIKDEERFLEMQNILNRYP